MWNVMPIKSHTVSMVKFPCHINSIIPSSKTVIVRGLLSAYVEKVNEHAR